VLDLPEIVAPTAVIDLRALRANAAEMRSRSPLPIRLASKSIRVRGILQDLLAQDGFAGVLAYSAAEAWWLVSHGVRDVLVAYPTVDRATVEAVSHDPVAAREITFMVDLPEHLQLLSEAATGEPVRACLDVDCSLRLGRLTVGAHRSSVHTPVEAAALAAQAADMERVRLVGIMFYDAQVAGVPDSGPHIRLMKQRSWADLVQRRAAVRAAVEEYADLEIVNAGGTGSLHRFTDDGVVTDLAAGSGLFAPTLFDSYDDTTLRPAAFFVSPVVRKPSDDVVVTYSGGYIASGPPGASRVPSVAYPSGLKPFSQEGFGEVQTPLRGAGARALRVGDPVWFRHAKAGEMCERFDEVLLLDGDSVRRLPTYRGEGRNFG
jgi:D-serine deaminase-like pyridoxal phosphate-dependent protein